jgi:predicted ester cyclase
MSSHDAAAVASHHAEEGILESPWAGIVKGRPAIEQVHRLWFASFSDATFEVKDLLIDRGRVSWLLHVAGTDVGGFMGLAPSRKPFQFPVVILCTLGDGFIVRDRRVYDFSGLLIQLGVLKARPS